MKLKDQKNCDIVLMSDFLTPDLINKPIYSDSAKYHADFTECFYHFMKQNEDKTGENKTSRTEDDKLENMSLYSMTTQALASAD
jgi:hypothetical protein